MRRDVLELDRFYRSRQGRTARRMIGRRLGPIWPDLRDLDVLGIGFTNPYLDRWQGRARRCVSFMPAAQGAIVPGPDGVPTALGDETRLPFREALFDRVLLVHALEEAESLPALLREVWRVMAPEGRLMIVSPSRAGIWALLDSTPFGHGRPFSRGQLTRLLDDALLVPTAWSNALYAPPWGWSTHRRISNLWEEVGEYAWPALGGLIMVEAVKHNAGITPGLRTARVSRRALEGQSQPALSPRRVPSRAKRD
ncbi:methyltransferase domain-containing protein [Maricaulis sp.]|uniref:class I SAM-dependent methyltransferase n=1 Tax=Maricaulis sp. TaxID=1486257 RepID=UPI0025BDCCFF|nr:methyltransferase domain-containing protein [Maricaulis sp.]